jgi:organic radical activating enzyme
MALNTLEDWICKGVKSFRRARNRCLAALRTLGRYTTILALGSRYMTCKKIRNLLRLETEKLLRASRLRSFPYIAVIDVTNTCNLRCPYCPTGSRRNSGRERRFIDLSEIVALLKEAGDYIVSANLYNWGEPFLHPEIASIVKAFHDRNIFTAISSNFSFRNNKALESVCDAGLDHLIVSLSGASQLVHERYHRLANLDQVFTNLRHVSRYKRAQGRRRPVVECKYLLFKHNLHEVREAQQLVIDSGADLFRVVKAVGPKEAILETAERGPIGGASLCHQLWHTIVINADGGVSPCCFLFFKEDDFGMYCSEDRGQGLLMPVRNSESAIVARKLFDRKKVGQLSADLRHPCLKCYVTHEQPHLQEYLKSNPYARQTDRTGGP